MGLHLRRDFIHDRLEVDLGGLLREVLGQGERGLEDLLAIVGHLDDLVLAGRLDRHLHAADAGRHAGKES